MGASQPCRVLSWGFAESGELMQGQAKQHMATPRPISVGQQAFKGQSIQGVACGGQHSVVLCKSGRLFTCGANSDGQLGLSDPDMPLSLEPQRVTALSGVHVTQISCGDAHTAVLSHEGVLYSWGAAQNGRLGREGPWWWWAMARAARACLGVCRALAHAPAPPPRALQARTTYPCA